MNDDFFGNKEIGPSQIQFFNMQQQNGLIQIIRAYYSCLTGTKFLLHFICEHANNNVHSINLNDLQFGMKKSLFLAICKIPNFANGQDMKPLFFALMSIVYRYKSVF